ncbi:hypothetical protein LWI29_002715 [Acer saccharum]|uniref:RNase H type-1 domain-containing protein n=1 Tax=Acer saccharum TaxID=4024 RepID=A0AA39VQ81_ACESA|nr:hypothetical protein LWI29_002715 [Acer saccharum]
MVTYSEVSSSVNGDFMVRDLYLSPKNRYRRSCFAFVRFATLEEAERVEGLMECMCMDDLLSLRLLRYNGIIGVQKMEIRNVSTQGLGAADQVVLDDRGRASKDLEVGSLDIDRGLVQHSRPDGGDSSSNEAVAGAVVEGGHMLKGSSIKKHRIKTRRDVISNYLENGYVDRIFKGQNSKNDRWNLENKVANVLEKGVELGHINTFAVGSGRREENGNQDCKIGIGIVIRDHKGSVLASYYQCLNVSYNREIANTLTILKGLHFGNAYCGEPLVCIETDDSAVVKWINDASHLDFDCGVILNYISSISNHLGISSVLPGLNGTNEVALGLAKKALLLKNYFVWMNDFPLCVSGEVEAEKNC